MCVDAKKSSSEVTEILQSLVSSRFSLIEFDELGGHANFEVIRHSLMNNGSSKTRKVVGIDHDLGDDG